MTLRMPAEWAPHDAVWIGFPHMAEEWSGQIDAARRDVAAFANAVHDGGRGEKVHLLVRDHDNADIAEALVDEGVQLFVAPFGDIWLRDTGPIIVGTGTRRKARNFDFNWWGNKFVMPGDREIGAILAAHADLPTQHLDWVLEGGGIDVDGTGLCVTTEECLLNRNRNPTLTREDIAVRLHQSLGIDRLLWLGDGLIGDHTDGHVDNLARFVDEGRLALPVADGDDDPNAHIYADARARGRVRRGRDRRPPLARPRRIGRRDRGGELYELLYRQQRGGRADLWRRERRGGGRGARRAVPRTPRGRRACARHYRGWRQLPLLEPAASGLASRAKPLIFGSI